MRYPETDAVTGSFAWGSSLTIKGVKDLDALLDYAIENYGLKATVSALTAKAKAAAKA